MKLDFGALDPAPTAMVANLPYAVATPVLLRTIEQLPSLARWTVMVQKEIADRLRAAPGSRTYGSPSVVAQLACEVELVRKVDPAVFKPRPRVDSAILRLRRTGPGADLATRKLIRAAFAHRRKSLARSLEHGEKGSLAPARAGPYRARPGRRLAGRGALARAVRRPVREAPVRRLTAAPPRCSYTPPPSSTSASTSGRAVGRPARALLVVRAAGLADLIEVSEAERDEVVCPGVEGENLAARALAGLRERGWDRPPLRIEIEKRVPVAAGLGGGSGDAAAVLRLAAGEVGDLQGLAAELGADVPSQLRPALALVQGAGESVEPLPAPAPHAAVLLPDDGGLSTADVFAEADRLGVGREAGELEELAVRLREAAGAGASPLAYPELLVNDLEAPARSLRPGIGDALDELREAGAPVAILSGSGPTAVGLFADLGAARVAAAAIDRDDAIVCEAGRAP